MIDLKSDSSVLCTSCGKRKAIYLRRTSGEKLCVLCYEKVLIKSIKKTLRDIKELRPGITVTSVIMLERLVPSLTLLYLLNKVERRYGCNVSALIISLRGYEKFVEGIVNSIIIDKFGLEKNAAKVIDIEGNLKCMPTEMINSYLVTLSTKADSYSNIIVLPFTLNDVNEIILTSLLDGDLNTALILQSFRIGNITYILPFYSIPNYDIYIFSYLRGIYTSSLCNLILELNGCKEHSSYRDYLIIKELVKDLSYNNPELSQTLIKSINKLFRRDLSLSPET
ncbi:MAG: hypothetical protein QXO98_02555 [Sulfolobales archaeon]